MILGIWGDDKTCKTTLALTAPKPMVVLELDIGGFERASHRFKADIDAGLIKVYSFPFPIQGVEITPTGEVIITGGKKLNGFIELRRAFESQFIKSLLDKEVKSILPDTGTLMWEMECQALLQTKQEAVKPGERMREKLAQIEYAEANSTMRGLIYNCQKMGKNLVMTHHSRDEFKERINPKGEIESYSTGIKERAGWSKLGDAVDVSVHTTVSRETKDGTIKIVPKCSIDLCGLAKEAEGLEVREPTWDKLVTMINMMRGE